MTRYHWADTAERHLADWAYASDDRTVDYAHVRHTRLDGTHTDSWTCTAGDVEASAKRGGPVPFVIHGSGPTRATAADRVLTALAERALTAATE